MTKLIRNRQRGRILHAYLDSGSWRLLTTAAVISLLVFGESTASAQTCATKLLSVPKTQALYVYFPTAVDSTFPEFSPGDTSPIDPFTMANHDNSINTAQVRQRAFELMEAAYCEFDMNVKLTTTVPAPTEARWQIVGIGSDKSGTGAVGYAQDVDTNDSDPQDYSRVWVENLEDYTGAELSGGNSTMERWSRAIANLAAHESAHSYGGSHAESAPRTGEDAAGNHFIADPGTGASASTIADSFNHFGDRTYERLGHDIGLHVKTLGNWDFVNPNSTNADKLVITLLSSASTLTRAWWWNGSLSPWREPTLTKRSGATISFRGTNYNVFDLEFSTAKAWSGGPNGQAPPSIKFHVGASVNESDPVIVYQATLSSGGTDLPLHPRIFGYDAGITAGGGFAVSFFNTQAEDNGFLEISDLNVQFLPRMLDLEQMVEGGELLTIGGIPITPFQRRARDSRKSDEEIVTSIKGPIRVGDDPFVIPIAHLTDYRHLDEIIRKDPNCRPGQVGVEGPGFGVPSVRYCPSAGNVLSLFPATYVYVSAKVTEPNARQWDPVTSQFINAPLTTRVFFQMAGVIPDANDNNVDDLIDIRNGTSRDNNNNGIPDEVESGGWAASAHVGLTSPTGATSQVLDDGFSLDLGLEYELTSQFSLIGILSYDTLEAKGAGSDLDILHLSINGRYYATIGSRFTPFAQAGIGVYDVSPGNTEYGYNAALGLRWDFSASYALELLYKRHEIQTSSSNIEYSTAQIGVRWDL